MDPAKARGYCESLRTRGGAPVTVLTLNGLFLVLSAQAEVAAVATLVVVVALVAGLAYAGVIRPGTAASGCKICPPRMRGGDPVQGGASRR
jgi:hypothetical protein